MSVNAYRAGQWLLTSLVLTLLIAGCGGSPQLSGKPQSTNLPADVSRQIDLLPTPSGVDPQVFAQLKDELKRVLAAQGGKRVSAPPVNNASATHLTLDGVQGKLDWDYYATGDYDQNGEVNLGDLIPIAAHFGEGTGTPFPSDSIQSVIDGDSNGMINLADVTPLGVNFGRRVSAYNIYSSTNVNDVPEANDGPNGGAALVDHPALSTATGAGRKHFSFTLTTNPPGSYYWVRPTDGSSDGTPSNHTAPLGDTLTPAGGEVQLDDIVFNLPPDATVGDVKFTHSLVDPPAGFPSDFTPAGQAHDIGLDHPEYLNAPVILTVPYDDAGMGSDEDGGVVALHYDGTHYEAMTILSQDPVHNTLTVDSREFSIISLGYIAAAAFSSFATSYDVGFTPAANGWNINNFGSYFSPNGNCLGMSAYACWFFTDHAGNLFGHYSTAGGAPTSIAHLTATRAHLAQSQYWGLKFHNYEQTLGGSLTGRLMKYFLVSFNEPLILVMTGAPGGHACVVYGWDATGFIFYDVNYNSVVQNLPWTSAGGFGSYAGGFPAPGFTVFSFVASPSLGRTEDFGSLTTDAEAGFVSSADISLTSPTPDQEIDARDAQLTGSLSGSLNSLTMLLCYVKGQLQIVPVAAGAFDSTIPINNGDNTLILLAGVNISQQSNWYQNCATLIRNVKGTKQDADLLATLTWDQDQTDVDLYVTEPGGGETSWYGSHDTSNGMELDFDNTSGYGPEHISVATLEGDTVLEGAYVVRVHYYQDHGGGAVSGRVTIVLHEGKPDQTVQTFPFAIGTDDPGNAVPGGTGADWVDITNVTLIPIPPPA